MNEKFQYYVTLCRVWYWRFWEQSWSCVATWKHFTQQWLLVSSRNAGESALRDEVKQRPRRRLQEVKLALRLCFHNPVHPNFIMHILQIVLFTFPEALIRKKFVYWPSRASSVADHFRFSRDLCVWSYVWYYKEKLDASHSLWVKLLSCMKIFWLFLIVFDCFDCSVQVLHQNARKVSGIFWRQVTLTDTSHLGHFSWRIHCFKIILLFVRGTESRLHDVSRRARAFFTLLTVERTWHILPNYILKLFSVISI